MKKHVVQTSSLIQLSRPIYSKRSQQEWANMWPNSPVFIHFIPRTFPQSFIKIWWTKLEIYWKQYIWDQIWPNLGLNYGHARARMGPHVTILISLHSFHYQEHSLQVSSKSDEPNSRYIGIRSFWTRLSQLPRPLLPFLPFFSRTRFFPDMRFSQNVRGPLDLSF